MRALHAAGRAIAAREIAGRAIAEKILRAEKERGAHPPPDARFAPYDYLSALVAEHRIDGLTAASGASGGDRELWIAGDYVFHVRLLNRLGRPLPRPPADPKSEPGLGEDFELWAWPLDPKSTVSALFFGSDAGYLLQGDNFSHAGLDARPEDVLPNPVHEVVNSPTGATDQWIPLFKLPDS